MLKWFQRLAIAVTFCLSAVFAVAQQSNAVDLGSRETVRGVQENLGALGFDAGQPDGLMGRRTRDAIRAFETSIGAEPAGKITAALLDQIIAAQNAREAVAAIEAGDMAALDAALSKAAGGAPSPQIAAALRVAVKDNQMELARRLIGAGYANAADTGTPPLLHMAIANGNEELVTLLAGSLDDLERLDGRGVPALSRAVRERQFDAALALVRAGADVNNDADRGYTALHWAIVRSRPDLVAVMLGHGAEGGAAGPAGISPLDLAVTEGEFDAAAMLIKAGSTITKDHRYYDGIINIFGFYGPSGVVEHVEHFQALAFQKLDGVLQRTHLEVKPPEGYFLGGDAARLDELRAANASAPGGSNGKITLPPGKYGEIDYRVDLGADRRDIAVEGSIKRIDDSGNVQGSDFLRLVLGPENTVLGSYVVALGEIDPPTPRERIDPAIFAGIEVPEGATIYRIGAQMRLEAIW